jgi:hypothetical protein
MLCVEIFLAVFLMLRWVHNGLHYLTVHYHAEPEKKLKTRTDQYSNKA